MRYTAVEEVEAPTPEAESEPEAEDAAVEELDEPAAEEQPAAQATE